MTTVERTTGLITSSNTDDKAWVIDVLQSDDLNLANAGRLEPYGRAELKPFVKVIMWAMRIYVLLSLVLIIAQIYISMEQ